MQVVYSGGSNTPTPSPRLQRKQLRGYGRPVLPGYVAGAPPSSIVHRTVVKDKPSEEPESSLRDVIPAMRKHIAVVCLILNVVLPGMGTFISGLTVLCGSKVRLKAMTRKKVVWVNTWVALLQFVTAFLFLLGWIWSIVWGVAFVSISVDYYKKSPSKEQVHVPQGEIGGNITYDAHPSNGFDRMTYYVEPRRRPMIPESHSQPIIVLQEVPVIDKLDNSSPSRPIMDARTRHQKILRRQMSDNELSPFNLTRARLQEIVIHNTPIPNAQFGEIVVSSSEPGPSNHQK
ncbi:hypothetical protein ScPMuIL_013756 [Solemya velum]